MGDLGYSFFRAGVEETFNVFNIIFRFCFLFKGFFEGRLVLFVCLVFIEYFLGI